LFDSPDPVSFDLFLHQKLVPTLLPQFLVICLGQLQLVTERVLEAHSRLAADEPLEHMQFASLHFCQQRRNVSVEAGQLYIAMLGFEVTERLHAEQPH